MRKLCFTISCLIIAGAHCLAEEDFRVLPAATFYLIYLAGMTWFAIKPGVESGSIKISLLNGALLGGLCYATFDLTSQAVFKVWATHISVADILWGTFVTATSAAIATWVTLKFSG